MENLYHIFSVYDYKGGEESLKLENTNFLNNTKKSFWKQIWG